MLKRGSKPDDNPVGRTGGIEPEWNNVLRCDLVAAFEAGIDTHIEIAIKRLGMKILARDGGEDANTVYYKVEKILEPLPAYLSRTNHVILIEEIPNFISDYGC